MLDTMDSASRIRTLHNPDARQFEVRDGESVIGKAEYLDTSDGTQRIFFHTEVDEAYAGQGLAMRLAETALDTTVAQARRIVPVCPFIAGYVKKHQRYAPDVDQPTEEHVHAVRAATRAN